MEEEMQMRYETEALIEAIKVIIEDTITDPEEKRILLEKIDRIKDQK